MYLSLSLSLFLFLLCFPCNFSIRRFSPVHFIALLLLTFNIEMLILSYILLPATKQKANQYQYQTT